MPGHWVSDAMNPFAFFDLMPRFTLDVNQLRKLYLANQRKWHPDFHASNPDMHKEALEKTALNNKAYALLGEPFSRAKSVLLIHEIDAEKEQRLPAGFLMEMMELSDLIEEAISGNQESRAEAEMQLSSLINDNSNQLIRLAELYDSEFPQGNYSRDSLLDMAQLYQKNRYFDRLKKNLSGIREL